MDITRASSSISPGAGKLWRSGVVFTAFLGCATESNNRSELEEGPFNGLDSRHTPVSLRRLAGDVTV